MSEVSYEGCKDFRMRTVISLLTGRPVRIAQIRPRAIKAGLSDAEVSFLRLIDQITGGATISIGDRRKNIVFVFVNEFLRFNEDFFFCSRHAGFLEACASHWRLFHLRGAFQPRPRLLPGAASVNRAVLQSASRCDASWRLQQQHRSID